MLTPVYKTSGLVSGSGVAARNAVFDVDIFMNCCHLSGFDPTLNTDWAARSIFALYFQLKQIKVDKWI